MKIEEALKYIKQLGDGKDFTIRFIKRTTGKPRIMTCQTGVKTHLSEHPIKTPVDFKKHNLLPVFDTEKKEYRSVPIDGIEAIKIGEEWKDVIHTDKSLDGIGTESTTK